MREPYKSNLVSCARHGAGRFALAPWIDLTERLCYDLHKKRRCEKSASRPVLYQQSADSGPCGRQPLCGEFGRSLRKKESNRGGRRGGVAFAEENLSTSRRILNVLGG